MNGDTQPWRRARAANLLGILLVEDAKEGRELAPTLSRQAVRAFSTGARQARRRRRAALQPRDPAHPAAAERPDRARPLAEPGGPRERLRRRARDSGEGLLSVHLVTPWAAAVAVVAVVPVAAFLVTRHRAAVVRRAVDLESAGPRSRHLDARGARALDRPARARGRSARRRLPRGVEGSPRRRRVHRDRYIAIDAGRVGRRSADPLRAGDGDREAAPRRNADRGRRDRLAHRPGAAAPLPDRGSGGLRRDAARRDRRPAAAAGREHRRQRHLARGASAISRRRASSRRRHARASRSC